ncbi:hypothetical protein V8G54_002231 [Vigna mungo]|uniref:Secreted protein n=1 Tax=Vigna mungo TaxID=3915 RepID=A0AAQ3SAM7_VIGMU
MPLFVPFFLLFPFCLGFSHKEGEISFKGLKHNVSRREDLALQHLRSEERTCLGLRSGGCFCFLFCRLECELEFFFCHIGFRVFEIVNLGFWILRFRVLSVL